jgi:hypothetical protein
LARSYRLVFEDAEDDVKPLVNPLGSLLAEGNEEQPIWLAEYLRKLLGALYSGY